MRTLAYFYTVETPGYTKDGRYYPARCSYPVYTDDMTPYEEEQKRLFTHHRQQQAEGLVLDHQIELKRQELARMNGHPVRLIDHRP